LNLPSAAAAEWAGCRRKVEEKNKPSRPAFEKPEMIEYGFFIVIGSGYYPSLRGRSKWFSLCPL
jgi:hypothetical protein